MTTKAEDLPRGLSIAGLALALATSLAIPVAALAIAGLGRPSPWLGWLLAAVGSVMAWRLQQVARESLPDYFAVTLLGGKILRAVFLLATGAVLLVRYGDHAVPAVLIMVTTFLYLLAWEIAGLAQAVQAEERP